MEFGAILGVAGKSSVSGKPGRFNRNYFTILRAKV
jgi:hypothetical protein